MEVASLSGPTVPKLDGVVEPGAGNVPAVGRERNVVDLLLVSRQTREGLLGVVGAERRPEEERVVVRARDEQLGRDRGERLVAGECEGLRCDRNGRSAVSSGEM